MPQEYQDLYALFRHEHKAEAYFETLPADVRDRLSAQSRMVRSFDTLRAQAQDLMKGAD